MMPEIIYKPQLGDDGYYRASVPAFDAEGDTIRLVDLRRTHINGEPTSDQHPSWIEHAMVLAVPQPAAPKSQWNLAIAIPKWRIPTEAADHTVVAAITDDVPGHDTVVGTFIVRFPSAGLKEFYLSTGLGQVFAYDLQGNGTQIYNNGTSWGYVFDIDPQVGVIFSGANSELRRVNAATGQVEVSIADAVSTVRDLCIDPVRQVILVAGNNRIDEYNYELNWIRNIYTGGTGYTQAIALNPNRNYVYWFSQLRMIRRIEYPDPVAMATVNTVGFHTGPCSSLSITPDDAYCFRAAPQERRRFERASLTENTYVTFPEGLGGPVIPSYYEGGIIHDPVTNRVFMLTTSSTENTTGRIVSTNIDGSDLQLVTELYMTGATTNLWRMMRATT